MYRLRSRNPIAPPGDATLRRAEELEAKRPARLRRKPLPNFLCPPVDGRAEKVRQGFGAARRPGCHSALHFRRKLHPDASRSGRGCPWGMT